MTHKPDLLRPYKLLETPMYSDIARVVKLNRTLGSRIAGVIFTPALWAVLAYRLAHLLWRMEIPLLPRLISVASRIVTGIDIAPSARIGPGLLIRHGTGMVIEDGVGIGSGATIFQGVGLGRRFGINRIDGPPVLGDDVSIFAGAKVLGPITIGNRCLIGANAVVLRSFPDDMTITGIPATSKATKLASYTTVDSGTLVIVDPVLSEEAISSGVYAAAGTGTSRCSARR